jgi:hypothetical protein
MAWLLEHATSTATSFKFAWTPRTGRSAFCGSSGSSPPFGGSWSALPLQGAAPVSPVGPVDRGMDRGEVVPLDEGAEHDLDQVGVQQVRGPGPAAGAVHGPRLVLLALHEATARLPMPPDGETGSHREDAVRSQSPTGRDARPSRWRARRAPCEGTGDFRPEPLRRPARRTEVAWTGSRTSRRPCS